MFAFFLHKTTICPYVSTFVCHVFAMSSPCLRHVFPAIRAQAAERLRVAAKERQQSPEGFVKELQNAMCLAVIAWPWVIGYRALYYLGYWRLSKKP